MPEWNVERLELGERDLTVPVLRFATAVRDEAIETIQFRLAQPAPLEFVSRSSKSCEFVIWYVSALAAGLNDTRSVEDEVRPVLDRPSHTERIPHLDFKGDASEA